MATSRRKPATKSAGIVTSAMMSVLIGAAALAAATQATAQPVDPALPPAPPPPPAGAPYIPPVQNADFNNTGQFDFLRDLWTMRNSIDQFQSISPEGMDPNTWLPPGAPLLPQAPPPGSPPVPASAPPPIWPPMPLPAPVP